MASALAAAEVSLHCVICFEEFDLHERPPVVLPCGHTYVCKVCAKKIKRCMECREPLFWTPPSTVQQAKSGPPSHIHRSPIPSGRTYAAARNARLGIGAPQTPPHPNLSQSSSNNGSQKEEPVALPLPKNVVLMEMIEAKERQERVMREEESKRRRRREANQHGNEQTGFYSSFFADDMATKARLERDDSYSSSSDSALPSMLDPALSGMSAFSGTCGTYAVREPTGLVVLPQDPNRRRNLQHLEQHLNEDSKLFKEDQSKRDYLHLHGLEFEAEEEQNESDEKKEQAMEDTFSFESSARSSSFGNHSTLRNEQQKEPFKIEEGQKVQVVKVDEGIYQLARGTGFIVATANQLVKVGGPLESSCKLEGMFESVIRKKQELQKQMDEINILVEGLNNKIRLEKDQPEDVPVIGPVPPSDNNNVRFDTEPGTDGSFPPAGKEPSTPPKPVNRDTASPGAVQPTMSTDSTTVELGFTPRTPGLPSGPYLEMESSNRYAYSPAHSCPMPANAGLDQPYMDCTPTGLPRYRVNSDDDMYGLGWAGALGCGSTLFGERLLETSTRGNELLSLSFDENSLLNDPSTRSRAAALAAAAGATSSLPALASSAGSNDSPLRSGGSFDGVNFRTGMSGHRGASAAPKRHRNAVTSSISMGRPRIRMMSEHRGIAALRNAGGTGSTSLKPSLKRRTNPDGFVWHQDHS